MVVCSMSLSIGMKNISGKMGMCVNYAISLITNTSSDLIG